jgi:hypothetical protein
MFGDGLIQGGEQLATIAAKGLGFVPVPGADLTIGSNVWYVAAVMPVYVQGVAVTYQLLVRL